MKKNIAVHNIPDNIRESLVAMGYNIVDDSYQGHVDTILYNSDDGSLSYLNIYDNVIDMTNGAFIVDINNKNPQEIVSIIENRSYTSLF